MPHFELPEIVVTFDFSLEASFARWGKDRHDAQTEAQMDQASQPTGLLVRALKAAVVIKLSESGSAESVPVRLQTGDGLGGGEGGARPRNRQAATEGNGIEDFHHRAVFNGQPFNDIEGIEFGAALGHVWQVPAWRRWSLSASRALNQAMPGQNPSHGALRRQRSDVLLLKMAQDSGGAEFAEDRMPFEPEPCRENSFFQPQWNPIPGLWIPTGSILPAAAVQSFAFSAMEPFEGCADAHVEMSGDGAERSAAPKSGNHQAPL